ncbi:TetR/AcrR family transcriptional regulator [Pseudonocardia kunmingensis]|nr:TetR/AcrR family transcriptional regulator [Pseudonocardia kunmingensis]
MRQDANGPQSGSSTRRELPVVGAVAERADAARNRARILAAAEQLFDAHGVDAVTMDDVVAAAGVGKGTLFRRFRDKGGLAAALLDRYESELQERLLSGPPPLGPGAAPAERLGAFVWAYLRYVDERIDLVQMSQSSAPGARLRTGAHALWRRHLVVLLTAAGVEGAELRADLLLAGLAAEQVRYWLRDEGRDRDRLAQELTTLALAS